MVRTTSWLLLHLGIHVLAHPTHAFVVEPIGGRTGSQASRLHPRHNIQKSTLSSSATQLHMVFDFFKQKSTEGIDQLNKLADANYRGELGKGLRDVAEYTKASNAAFANGLAKSRVQLLENMETLFTGMSPEDFLEDLQDILLQADLGVTVAEEVVEEVRALRQDSTKMLKKDDLRSILRGKLIETLDTGSSGAIQFSTKDDIPTVIFVMGANGMGVSFYE